MKCYGCNLELSPDSAAYSLNYQDKKVKFYGLMWCKDCGTKIMELVKRNRLEPKKWGKK